MYGVISLPFFSIFQWREQSIFMWSLVLIGIIVILVCLLFRNRGYRSLPVLLVIVVSLLGSPYLYGPRPEVLNIALMLLGLLWLDSLKQEPRTVGKFIILATFPAVIGLVQPVGGLFFSFLLVVYGLQNRFSIRFYLSFIVTLLLILSLSYGSIILIDINYWISNFFTRFSEGDGRGRIDLYTYIKHTIYTPFIYVPYLMTLIATRKRQKILIELLILLAAIGLLLPFSRSYYYPYIMVVIIWRISVHPEIHFPRWLVSILVICIPVFSHYWPTVQQLENRNYVATFKLILRDAAEFSLTAEHNNVWVPASIAMPIIEERGSRLYFAYYRTFFGAGIEFEQGDVILATTEAELKNAVSLLPPDLAESEIQIHELVSPVKGLITLTPWGERSDSLGLWEIRRIKP